MGSIANNFFQKLFTNRGTSNMDSILSGIEQCISDEANFMLTAKYIEDEIRTALKGMGSTKALGDDGFPTLFFQKC